MKRYLSTAGLLELAAGLSTKERRLVELVARLRLMSHAQLAAMLGDCSGEATSASTARMTRRTLSQLTKDGMLARLERRIGGVRAGSSGYVYYLGPAGQRLVAYWRGHGFVRGRYRPDPGARFVQHRLAVSETYVRLCQAGQRGDLELLSFDAEPDSWRSFPDGFGARRALKPDAFTRIALGAYEDLYFLEIDLATESRNVVVSKLRAYADYFNSGEEQSRHGVFPRVLILANSEERCASLVESCSRLPAEAWQLFTIGKLDRVVDIVTLQQGHNAMDELGALS